MSSFLKSKLVLILVTFFMIASAIAIPLSRSQTRTYAQGTLTISEFPLPSSNSYPGFMASGPDGALWFTEPNAGQVGRVTTSGTVTEFPITTSNSFLLSITTGLDGNLWFTEGDANKIGRITTSGTVTEFPIPTANSGPQFITTGPDGAIWFTEGPSSQIGRITTNGTITEFPTPTPGSDPSGITSGPDGAIWFVEEAGNGNKIGRITTSGTITEFPTPTANSNPFGITTGPDGALWFAESGVNQIGRITTSGTITEFPGPTNGSDPTSITNGPDGALWFTDSDQNLIERITTSGTITEFPIPTANSNPLGITRGSDGNLWFAENGTDKIGRVNLPSPTVTVQKVWTADGNGNTKTAFAPGDAIHYMALLNNMDSSTVTATVTVLATGPQQIYSSSIAVPIAAGLSTYIVAATIPRTAPTGTYTLTFKVTYDSVSSSGQSQFTVTAGKPILTSTTGTTPPAPTTSRYMKTVDPTTLMSEGQAQARSGESGIVVLDFGEPFMLNNVYGSCLFISKSCFRSTDQVASAAEAFLKGYASTASSGQYLTLAIGTNNYGKSVASAHGQAWASMVNQVGQWIATQGFTNIEQVAGASDIELGWNSAATSRAWADGYNSSFNPNLQFGYFDYGDAAGCPASSTTADGKCNGGWHQSDVVYVSWDVRAAYPLPEIYTVAGSKVQQANQWYSLSLYSHNHQGSYGPMFIEGSFTQQAACQIVGCNPSVDNTPQQGWQLLSTALNADTRTAQPLPFSSDITWAN